LVSLMDGTTTVESKPGAGSIFRFDARFPLPAIPPSREEPLLDLSNRRILVVDDSEASREAVRLLLADLVATVTVANSGSTALELIRLSERQWTPFDSILIDSSLPDLDGDQIVRLARHAHARFVMMLPSGNLKAETMRLQAAGIEEYVVKPVKRSDLLAAVAA